MEITAVYRVSDPKTGSSVDVSREACDKEEFPRVEKWARWAGMSRGLDYKMTGETHKGLTDKLLAFLATKAQTAALVPNESGGRQLPPVEVQLAAPTALRPAAVAGRPAPAAPALAVAQPAPAAPRPAPVAGRPAPAAPAPASPQAAPAAAARPARRRAAPAARSVAAVMAENSLRMPCVTNEVLRKLLDNRNDLYGARDTKNVLIDILLNVANDEDLPTEQDIEDAKDDAATEKEFLAAMQKCSLAEKRATLSRRNTPAI